MIAYMPEIYPDELVYSWFCRYYIHSGCISHKMALQEILYKRCNNPSKEFIGHLNPEMEKLIKRMYSMDELIINHTMYSQYARFIQAEQKKKALHHMSNEFCDMHYLFTILPRNDSDRYMKYCPLCVDEDRANYGEAYWRRSHQIRNTNICTKHKCKLINSSVLAISNQTFTLNPLELCVDDMSVEYEDNLAAIEYAEYLYQVFHAPFDFDNDIPISAALYYGMSNTKYMKSEKVRNTKQLVDDMNIFYESIGIKNPATISQVQKTLLCEQTEFTTVCQIAFYLGMSVEELTAPVLTAYQIEKEQNTHYTRGNKGIDWEELDNETAPILEKMALDIYTGVDSEIGRPEKVTVKLVCKRLGMSEHRIENLPKCKAIIEKYNESYPESWARKLLWSYQKLERERGDKPFYWSDMRGICGVKKANIQKVIPYLIKIAGNDMADKILGKVEG